MGGKGETVVCRLQYSGAATALIGALAAATVGVIAITPGPAAARILGGTWTACAALAAARRVSHRACDKGVRTLVVRLSGEVAVQGADGRWTRGTLRDGSFVAPWLTVVRWRPAGRRLDRTMLLLPGMAEAESLRKIRLILRWG